MGNIIDFQKSKEKIANKKHSKIKQKNNKYSLFLKKVTSFKRNLIFSFKSVAYVILLLCKKLAGALLKFLATLTIFLFIVEWLMNRLGSKEIINSLILLSVIASIYIVAMMCIKLLRSTEC